MATDTTLCRHHLELEAAIMGRKRLLLDDLAVCRSSDDKAIQAALCGQRQENFMFQRLHWVHVAAATRRCRRRERRLLLGSSRQTGHA